MRCAGRRFEMNRVRLALVALVVVFLPTVILAQEAEPEDQLFMIHQEIVKPSRVVAL